MRICYLANAGSIHTQRWVKYFADKGHDVYLISHRPFGNDEDICNVSLFLLRGIRPQIKVVSYTANLLLNVIQIRKIVRKLEPDLLHAHYVTSFGFLGALSGFHPLILSAWGSDILVAPQILRINKLRAKFALGKANLTLTTSQYLKEYLHTEFMLPEHNIRAIPWGIDLGIFHKGYETEVKELRVKLGVDESNFVILSPRLLRDHYRIEYIVQAMPYILARYPNVILILLKGIAKDEGYESQINNLAKELGVAKNTRLIHEELKPKEMAALYNVSDALISIPRTDQFSACVQEGMACGAVPIVGNLEVYRQYLTDAENAFFVNPENSEEIAQRIIYCIEHPELKERFYEINRKIIEEKEDWDKNAPKMEKLYKSLIGGNLKK